MKPTFNRKAASPKPGRSAFWGFSFQCLKARPSLSLPAAAGSRYGSFSSTRGSLFMKKISLLLLALALSATASFAQNVTVTGSTGANATYATLKAAFDAQFKYDPDGQHDHRSDCR